MPPEKTRMKRKDCGVDLDAQTIGPYKSAPHQIGKAHKREIIDFNKDYMNLDEFFVQVNNQMDGSGSGNLTSQDEEATQMMKPNVDLLASLLTLGKMIRDQKVLIKQQQARQEQQHTKVDVEKIESSHVKHVTINQSITNTKVEPVIQQVCSSVHNDAMESQQAVSSKSLRNNGNCNKNVDEKHPPSSWSESESTLSIKRGLIPDTIKDVDYWDRRKRNNIAAKKSREERRKKELEVLLVTKQLESENLQLTTMLKRLSARNELLESRIQDIRERHLHNASSGTVSSSAEES